MKMLLVALPSFESNGRFKTEYVPPTALFTLGASVKNAGYGIHYIDPNVFSNMKITDSVAKFVAHVEEIVNELCLIGFSSNSFNWAFTKMFIEAIKVKFPNLPIVLGGLHPSVFPQHIFNTTDVDYIICGEGEIALVKLLKAINSDYLFDGIDGLYYRGKKGGTTYQLLSMDEYINLPLPDYRTFNNKLYDSFSVETSRGCKFSCAFCSIPHRYSWRGLSVEDTIKRVSYAKQYTKLFSRKNTLDFSDDCFTQDSDRAINILNELEKEKDGFSYFIEARVSNLLSNNLCEKINPNMIYQMQIGVECGYDEGLRKIRKGLTIKSLYECLSIMKKTGLNKKSFLSFIIGFPWETEENIMSTLITARKIVEEYEMECIINWLILLPSDLWNQREEYGIFVNESMFDIPDWISRGNLFMTCHPAIEREAFIRISKYAMDFKSRNRLFDYHHPAFRREYV